MACDLVLLSATPTAPTRVGSLGYVAITYSTSSASPVNADAVHSNGGIYSNYALDSGGGLGGFRDGRGTLYGLPTGKYSLRLHLAEQPDCQATGTFTVAEGAAPSDPSLTQPTSWQPVGGVLPNPVPLPIEANLVDAAGLPRPGLHVEVELWRPAAVAAFVSFRATVRQASQTVDAAPYLRAELIALQRYAAAASQPLIDADASLAYTYRYRIADRTGAEPWVVRAGVRYAVLAALTGAADTMAPYVADGTGKVASLFPDGEGVQFVGYPFEVSVLLPPATSTRYAELRYLDALGQPVEIRSYALASTLPAGMLRIPLPNNPPVCASAVEVSIRDDNRGFVGTCGHLIPTPPASTSGTYADPIYGTY
jgi:hypothetical protein